MLGSRATNRLPFDISSNSISSSGVLNVKDSNEASCSSTLFVAGENEVQDSSGEYLLTNSDVENENFETKYTEGIMSRIHFQLQRWKRERRKNFLATGVVILVVTVYPG